MQTNLKIIWESARKDLIRRHVDTFNRTAHRYLSGKSLEKKATFTWGNSCRNCLRHLEKIK